MAFDGDLGRYSLGPLLGQGGFGAAYRAEHENGMQCVVKLFHGISGADNLELERLRVVLARLKTVNSPHLVKVLDAGVDATTVGGAQPWLAMGYLTGTRSLDQVLRDGPVSREWGHRVLEQITQGLMALHGARMLHRDLKPANVLVDASGRAWLIDFDLVKVQDAISRTPVDDRLGTPLWMAPEQRLGITVTASDLWALGLIAHELLTGRHPVRSAIAGVGVSALDQAINAGRLVGVELPAPYDRLVGALLHKVPTARPRSAAEVLRWLQDPASGTFTRVPIGARPRPRWTLKGKDDIDALERLPIGRIDLTAGDVTAPARNDNVRVRGARRSGCRCPSPTNQRRPPPAARTPTRARCSIPRPPRTPPSTVTCVRWSNTPHAAAATSCCCPTPVPTTSASPPQSTSCGSPCATVTWPADDR